MLACFALATRVKCTGTCKGFWEGDSLKKIEAASCGNVAPFDLPPSQLAGIPGLRTLGTGGEEMSLGPVNGRSHTSKSIIHYNAERTCQQLAPYPHKPVNSCQCRPVRGRAHATLTPA